MEVSPVHGLGPSSLKTQTKKPTMNGGDLYMPIRWRPLENLRLKRRAKAQDQGLPKLSIVSELFDNKEGTGRGGRTKEWCEKKEGTSRGGRTKELYDNNEGGTSRGGRAKEEHRSKGHNDKVNGNGVPINGIMINNKKASTNGNGASMAQMGSASEQNTKSKEQEEGPMVSAMKVLSTSPGGSSVCVHTGIMREELTSSLWPGGGGGAASASSAVDIGSGNYLRLMQQGGLPYLLQEEPKLPLRKEEGPGLGIVDFLKGKNIFITGATGFLAKVLVEKVLQVQPDVGKLFLLIKAKDLNEAKRRLREEILYSHLFNQLQTKYGESYIQHMEAKLIPVVGNIEKDNLGMDAETLDALQNKLDLIINSAASTTFDERYDHAINLNTKGAQRAVDFALSCSRLQLFMHVSTAFVNGKREGIVQEKAFKIGCSIANETTTKDRTMAPDINLDAEASLIQERRVHVLKENQTNGSLFDDNEKLLQQAMKELGMERAKAYGWQDTYVFTKAMGEMLIDSRRGKLPVVIVRPSVVESSFKDPFPGWMEGNRMMDPIIISYGKGQLPGFLVDPESVLDVVPVDMVANAMLAAMARHANKPGLEVYQVASSVVNPLKFSQLARLSQEHFLEHPFMDNIGKPILTSHLELFQDMDSFVQAITNCSTPQKDAMPSTSDARALLKRHRQLTVKVRQQAVYLANLYRPYTFYAGRFDTSNTQGLLASLSYQEKQLFGFDLTQIDWDTYIKRIHIPGLKKHVLKGRGSNV